MFHVDCALAGPATLPAEALDVIAATAERNDRLRIGVIRSSAGQFWHVLVAGLEVDAFTSQRRLDAVSVALPVHVHPTFAACPEGVCRLTTGRLPQSQHGRKSVAAFQPAF